MSFENKTKRARRPPVLYEEKDFKDRLREEYLMLQAKADTIGGFRVTIKGWSVVALGAAAAASSKADGNTTVLFLSGSLAILIGIFFRLEFEQVRLSTLYLARAGHIERILIAVNRGAGEERYRRNPVPFTANEVVNARRGKQYADGDSPLKTVMRSHPIIYSLLVILAISIGGTRWLVPVRLIAKHCERASSANAERHLSPNVQNK